MPAVMDVNPEKMPVIHELRGHSQMRRCMACIVPSEKSTMALMKTLSIALEAWSKAQKPSGWPQSTPR